MSCDKCEEALAKAREDRDFWKQRAVEFSNELNIVAIAVADLHYLIDPRWDDE